MGSVISTHLHVLRRILTCFKENTYRKAPGSFRGSFNFWNFVTIRRFAWFINNFFSSVPANFRSLVYFYGIKNGGVEEWDFAFKQFQKTTVASERRKILYGLAGASEPWILSRLVWYSPSGSLPQTNLFVEE